MWLIVVVGGWFGRTDTVDKVSVDRNGSKNGSASEYGTGDVGIRVKVGLFGVMGSPRLYLLSEKMAHNP